jgi:hypothetical protein
MKKSQNIPVWFRKLVLFSSPYHIIAYFAVAGRDIATACTCKKKECNKLDLTAAQCFLLAHHTVLIGPSGLLLVVPPPNYLLSKFQFYGWGCEFCEHTAGDALMAADNEVGLFVCSR